MAKIIVRNQTIKTLTKDGVDYICITDIARQKNPVEPKDVVKIGYAPKIPWSIWDFGNS